MGMLRNEGWHLINSCAGYRTPPAYFDGFPLAVPSGGFRHWALSGAIWDPHGYWGAADQYLIPDNPFYTYGLASYQQSSPGAANGLTTPHRFYGLGGIHPGEDAPPWQQSSGMHVRLERLDAANNVVGEHTIGDSATSAVFPFRHFGIANDGRYRLVLPATPPPGDYFNLIIDNGWRSSDSFLLAVPWDGAQPVTGRLDSGYSTHSLAARLAANTARVLTSSGSSINDVLADATGSTMWQDTAANLVWVKHVGGLAQNVYQYDGRNKDSLRQRYQLRLRHP